MLAAAACRRTLFKGRHWSSAAETPSLKAALRAVYKTVHPDLFHDCQPAKEANTKSFKLLHEYLEAARTGSRIPLPYRFHFYIRSSSSPAATTAAHHRSPSQQAAPAAAATAVDPKDAATAPAVDAAGVGPAAAGLREVVLTLPPPTRGAPGEAMSSSSRKAFGSLLAALGLPSRFGGAEGGEEEDGLGLSRLTSLREFLPQAVEAVHQHAATQSSAQHQLAALRTALRLGRGVAAGFGGPSAAAGVLEQLSLVQRLAAALDSLPPSLELSGLRVTVGQASGVDALGTVWPAASESQTDWARHLGNVDAAHCRQRQMLLAQVKAQEGAVAAALGLAMVFPQQPEMRLAPEYREALERLAAAAAARGPASGGRFRELPLQLRSVMAEAGSGEGDTAPAGSSSSGSSSGSKASSGGGAGRAAGAAGSGSSELGECIADEASGLLVAPLDVTGDQLYAAVQQLGGRLLSAAAAAKRRQQELEAVRKQVERKIMLRRLLRDPTVPDSSYRSCLDRMLAHAQKLAGLLHGHAVRVAHINALSRDKAVIDIAWNWRM